MVKKEILLKEVLNVNVLKGIVNRVKKRNTETRKKCYEEHGNKDGTCYGLVGGDSSTGYIQYACISCKYWKYYAKETE